MNVHLHIEQLVIDGLPAETVDADKVRAAVRTELTHLLNRGTLLHGLRTGRTDEIVPIQGIHLTGAETPTDLGQKIAGAIFSRVST